MLKSIVHLAEYLNELLPTLQRLSRPLKFILTLGEQIHHETVMFPFLVLNLSEEAALVRHEPGLRNQSFIVNAPDEALQPVADDLYTFIYRYAWNNLDELAQKVLLAMPLMTDSGEAAAYIEKLLPKVCPEEVRDALGVLVSLNLVNRPGTFQQSRYAIHNLTRSFLLKQVAKWM